MRNAFADELLQLAMHDERIVLLSGDIGNNLFNEFKDRFPDRFLNCGAAEANMTGVAAGMALAGLRPVTYTIAAFNPGRCAEQIRLDICQHNLPVVVVGVGAGLSYASLGPTHHSLEDVAWMRCLPNMSIMCPADAVETRCSLRAAFAHSGPVYLRLGKKNEPVLHQREPALALGQGLVLREGHDVCVLALGTVAPVALQAADLLRERGVSCMVASLCSLKPLDETLLEKAFGHTRVVGVLEEHVAAGGAWSAVAEWLAQRGGSAAKALRFGTPDSYFTEGGNQSYARTRMGLTAEKVSEQMYTAYLGSV